MRFFGLIIEGRRVLFEEIKLFVNSSSHHPSAPYVSFFDKIEVASKSPICDRLQRGPQVKIAT